MKRLSAWLHKISTGWVTVIALVIFLLFTALVLPSQSANGNPSAEEVGSPDMSFFYSSTDLYRMAEAYGSEGRSEYIRARLTFDVIWPLVYTFFLGTALSWVFGLGIAPDSPWQRANLIPVAGMLLDYLENLSTSLVMFRYPANTPVIDFLAPIFTAAKWVFVNGSFVILLVGFAILFWEKIRQQA